MGGRCRRSLRICEAAVDSQFFNHSRASCNTRREGKLEKLTLVVLDSDLEPLDFEIKFAKGKPWRPELKHFFKEGQRTRVIDFPGDERTIKYIDFKYRNLPGGGRAKVQVWAK